MMPAVNDNAVTAMDEADTPAAVKSVMSLADPHLVTLPVDTFTEILAHWPWRLFQHSKGVTTADCFAPISDTATDVAPWMAKAGPCTVNSGVA